MTLRTRILDMLPALLVFAVVSAFSTFVLVEYVVREPVVVPHRAAPTAIASKHADLTRPEARLPD
jgi:hypothetical protein